MTCSHFLGCLCNFLVYFPAPASPGGVLSTYHFAPTAKVFRTQLHRGLAFIFFHQFCFFSIKTSSFRLCMSPKQRPSSKIFLMFCIGRPISCPHGTCSNSRRASGHSAHLPAAGLGKGAAVTSQPCKNVQAVLKGSDGVLCAAGEGCDFSQVCGLFASRGLET